MGKKELWQIGWAGGQTEGDLGRQTVERIINAEIHTLGTLIPRDELVHASGDDESISNLISMKFMTNPADPDEALAVFLTTTHIRIRGATTTEDLALGVTIDTDSEMTIVEGSAIYVAAIVSGSPYGIITATYINSGKRFRPPDLLTNHGSANELTGTAQWIVQGVTEVAPILEMVYVDATYTSDTDTALAANADRRVVVGTFLDYDFKQGDHHDYPVTSSMSIEVAVQFEFQDGQLSPVSNSDVASHFMESQYSTDRNMAIGITLAVSRSLSETVKRIHVYRRVRELDGVKYDPETLPYELAFIAPVMSDDLDDGDVPATSAHLLLNDYNFKFSDGGTYLFGQTGLAYGTGPISFNDITQNRSIAAGGSVVETAGWLEYETGTMFYWPRSIVYSGDLTMKTEDGTVTTSDFYSGVYSSSIGVFLYPSGTGSQVTMYTGISSPETSYFNYTPYANVSCAGTDVFPYQERTVSDNVEGWGHDIAPYMIKMGVAGVLNARNGGNTNSNTVAVVIDREPVMAHPDIGEAGILTLDDAVGYAQVEDSEVKPRHITASAGRLLMLNVEQDGESKVSRLCYSQFRKYRAVAKSNYVDYDARDDGHGVGIAEFKGRVIVLHSTSAYIMDISAGSGMSWRELGAYNEINSLGRPAIAESPFGVFFGGKDYAYLFDGNKIQNITETPERRVSTAYREMTASGTPSFAWRADLRQLWIVSLGTDEDGDDIFKALVYDADTGSWHIHWLNELTYTSALPRTFLTLFNEGGEQYAYSYYNSATVERHKFDDTTTRLPFDWGLYTGQINMGASEWQKKLKRVYVDTVPFVASDGTPTYGDIELEVDGFTQDFTPASFRNVERLSASNKGYYLDFTLMALKSGDKAWKGTIESLGISFKPKKQK